MLSTLVNRRMARLLAAAVALAGVAACNDDATGPDDRGHADEVHAIRLTITQGGTASSVTYEEGMAAAAYPTLAVPVGTSTVVATFLAEDGDVLTDVDADEHAIAIQTIVPAAAMSFARTGAFAGTITAPAAATATATVCLTHGDHCDLEFVTVPVAIGG